MIRKTKAFPLEFRGADGRMDLQYGMDLRDYFAAHALAALGDHEWDPRADEAAQLAYKIADAMLRARNSPASPDGSSARGETGAKT